MTHAQSIHTKEPEMISHYAFSVTESMLAERYRETLTDLLHELQEDPEAIELFAEFQPSLWDDLAEQGYRCLELEQSVQARDIFSFLLDYFEDEPAYHAGLADALSGCKRYLDAAEHYHETTSLAPDIPDAYYFLAELWMILKHPCYALEQYEAARALMDDQHPLAEKTTRQLGFAQEAAEKTQS